MNKIEINSNKAKQIVEKAKELFWKYGIKKVSIKEICKKSGVSKMTFYRSFDNKIDLAKTVLELQFQQSIIDYQTLMSQPISFKEKMEQNILLKQKGLDEISEEFIKDIMETQEKILLDTIEQYSQKSMQMVLDDFRQAQIDGAMRSDIKPEFIQYFLYKSREMIKDPYLLNLYENRKELTMEITRLFFHGIINNK